MDIQPITLEGRVVRLEPAELRHATGLAKHAQPGPDIFDYHFPPPTLDEDGFSKLITHMNQRPNWLFFAIVLKQSNEAIGTTAYLDIQSHNRHLEIGFTWIPKAYHGTNVNPEMKYLMLHHAFEDQDALRVQLKTDGRNTQSQRAIEKLGAKKEGILRKHVVMPDGFVRDTVMYSIIRDEWAQVKAGLEARLGYSP